MKVTTMRYVRTKSRRELFQRIEDMKSKGWYCVGDIEMTFNASEGHLLSQCMAFEGEKECTHEYAVIGDKKLCYHCLHKIPIDETVNNS